MPITRRDFLRIATIGSLSAAALAWEAKHGTLQNVFASPNLDEAAGPANPNSFGIDPMEDPAAMADKVFGPGQWMKADNYSAHRAYFAYNGQHDMPDLKTPGEFLLTDPTGEEAADHGAIDWKANATTALLTPNWDNLPSEMAAVRQQPERAGLDSHFLWARGNGDLRLTYVWGDGTETVVEGHVTGERFTGKVNGAEALDIPASFQTVFFDQTVDPFSTDALVPSKAILSAPSAIVVQAKADETSYLNVVTGPSSAYDADGEGNKDYQDAGFRFAPKDGTN